MINATREKVGALRISTAATRRAIDRWKERTHTEASRFYVSTAAIFVPFLSGPRERRLLLAFFFVFASMVNFAFSEFALLTLLCLLTVKLQCYRLFNAFLRVVPYAR